jgi:uncharacterized protein YecE (DUF72 family)
MDNVLVGTAGWTDPTLLKSGKFYPPEVKTPEDRLRFYAEQFPIVEVDSIYYAMPSADTSRAWVSRTPVDFHFDIKAFRLFTLHQTPLKALPTDLRGEAEAAANKSGNVYYRDLPRGLRDELWQRFKDGLQPLRDAGKLGYILLQWPAWEFKNHHNIEHIQECASRLDGYALAVEFRNASWFTEGAERETLAVLRETNLAFVIVDEPQGFHSSVPAIWQATSPDLSVVRFHGRNAQTWMKKNQTAAERFNYLYSEGELAQLAQHIDGLRRETKQVHAMFNNCYEDKAQRNAKQLLAMLR